MAARKRVYHDPKTLERIQTSQLINRLNANAMGTLPTEMTPGQIKSAEILLRKVVPDLSSIDHVAEINHRYVADVPLTRQTIEEWHNHSAPPTVQ